MAIAIQVAILTDNKRLMEYHHSFPVSATILNRDAVESRPVRAQRGCPDRFINTFLTVFSPRGTPWVRKRSAPVWT
ncbi:MAG TPA: hypothetical protein PLF51_00490 [Candidatus Hydrogenedentes bacterium]|nr:hypothetical protein [Candidatus Hydrogenedentota bacterium]